MRTTGGHIITFSIIGRAIVAWVVVREVVICVKSSRLGRLNTVALLIDLIVVW